MFDAKTVSTEQLQELPDSPVLSYVSAYLGNYTTINEQVSYVERQVEHLIPELETISNLLHVNHLVPRRLGREYGFGHFVAPYVITVGFTTGGA